MPPDDVPLTPITSFVPYYPLNIALSYYSQRLPVIWFYTLITLRSQIPLDLYFRNIHFQLFDVVSISTLTSKLKSLDNHTANASSHAIYTTSVVQRRHTKFLLMLVTPLISATLKGWTKPRSYAVSMPTWVLAKTACHAGITSKRLD